MSTPEPQTGNAEKTQTIGVQTIYRESEAQTDPFTPEYVLKEGEEEPEVLLLAKKIYGDGLPVGLREVHLIERARQKKAFESSLPPLTDEASFELRKKMMEAQERREHADREAEIDELNAERTRLVKNALQAKRQETEYEAKRRLEAQKNLLINKRDVTVAGIQRDRIKALRKLANQRKDLEKTIQMKSTKRDIIADYANFKSTVYAPKTRLGLYVDRDSRKYETNAKDLSTYEGILGLEKTMATSLRDLRKNKGLKYKMTNVMKRRKRVVKNHLEHTYNLIEESKNSGSTDKSKSGAANVPAWLKKKTKVVRPDTPVVEEPANQASTNAIIVLQKLLRGRAVQNMMYEARDRRRELLRELRYEEELEEKAMQHAQEEARKAAAKDVEEVVRSTREKIVGEVMSSTLNFLANHKKNMDTQNAINAMAWKAEELRRKREAEESGRRQAEEMLRRRHDEMFRQLMGVHHQTVDSYVDELIEEMSDTAAADAALKEISLSHSVMNPIMNQLEAGNTKESDVIRDLLSSMLLPEVEKRMLRREIEMEERRFVDAAHKSITNMMSDVKEELDAVAQAKAEAEEKDKQEVEAETGAKDDPTDADAGDAATVTEIDGGGGGEGVSAEGDGAIDEGDGDGVEVEGVSGTSSDDIKEDDAAGADVEAAS